MILNFIGKRSWMRIQSKTNPIQFARAVASSPTPVAASPPQLDDGFVSQIARSLSSKDAFDLAAVCPRWRALLSQPPFLSRHLAPQPMPRHDGRPRAIILQPTRKLGFSHITLVATNPADCLAVNVPVQPKYIDPPWIPSRPPLPKYIDPPPRAPEEAARRAPAPPPPLEAEWEDYVVFFERTVPMLDISIVAAHGRLLLGRSRSRYYVCDPAANRWLALPPSTIPPGHGTNCGIHYDDVDAATGTLSFTVVLLACRKRRRVIAETFTSATGRWDARELPSAAQGVAASLGAASPGIHVDGCFYWPSCRNRPGRLVRYDAGRGHASVLPQPTEAEGSKGRAGMSLGSAGGRLRLCAFDIRDENSECMLPHDDIEGVHGVWVMDADADAATGWAWRRVHEATVEDMSAYYFLMLFDRETPVDFAGACVDFILVERQNTLLRYDLESGSEVELALLYRGGSRLNDLYGRFHAFAFFG